MQYDNSNNVHQLYTICTPIMKHTMCTLKRHLTVHLTVHLYKYLLIRFFTKVLKKGFIHKYALTRFLSELIFFLNDSNKVKASIQIP